MYINTNRGFNFDGYAILKFDGIYSIGHTRILGNEPSPAMMT